MSFPMQGFTDGNGNVAGLPEDEDDPFASIVSDAVTSQFDIAPGFTEAAPGEVIEPEPVYEPAPQGDNFFGEHGLEIAEQDAPWQPTIRMGGDNSSLADSADFFFTQQFGAAPTPGSGLGAEFASWFGTPEEQQNRAAAWNDAVNAAIQNGDATEYARLMRERDVVDREWQKYQAESATFGQQAEQFYGDFFDDALNPGFMPGEGPPDLFTRGVMDQIGTPTVDTPYGPMSLTDALRQFEQDQLQAEQDQRGSQGRMFDVDRADAMQIFPQLDDARNAQMARDRFFTLPNQFGGPNGDPFAEGQLADYRDFALSQGNLRWDTSDSAVLDAIGTGLGATAGAAKWLGNQRLIGLGDSEITGTDALKAAWWGVNVGAEKTWQGVTYASAAERYLSDRSKVGLGPVSFDTLGSLPLVEAIRSFHVADIHYREGDGLAATMRQTYDTQPWYVRAAGETVFDPLNFVGAGLVKKGVDAAQWGQHGIKTVRIRHATQEAVDAGLLSPELVRTFSATKPTLDKINRLKFAYDDLVPRIMQTGIPDDASLAVDSLAKRLVMEWHIAGQTGGNLDGTTKRVYDEMLRVIEQKYGTQVANQVAKTRNQVDQLAAIATNPNAIPLSNGGIAIIDGNRLQMVIPPGKRLEQQRRLDAFRRNQALSTFDKTLPSGLTRRSGTGEIVTVARKTADDALQAAVRAENATNDVRVMQRSLDLTAAPTAPAQGIARTPDPAMTDLLPPAPPRQIEGVPVEASMDQMRWLQFYSQRDGVNYWDELVASGGTDEAAVVAKLRELDAGGQATAQQMVELRQLGVAPSRQMELARRPTREVAAEIDRLKRAAPPGPQPLMTADEFYAAAAGNPTLDYAPAAVSRAARLSEGTGMDLLRDAVTRGMDRATFAAYTDADNLPLTRTQRQQLQRMVEQGSLPPIADYDRLSLNGGLKLYRQGKRKRGFLNATEALIEHNIVAPSEVVSATDVAADAAADSVVIAKRRAQDYLRKLLPEFTAPKNAEVGAAKFRTRVAGQQADQGVPVMSPVAMKQWATDMSGTGAFRGTTYEQITDEIARAVIFVDKGGTFSSQTADAAFERLMRDLVEMAGKADLDDTRRFVDELDSATNGDRYRAITENIGRKVKGVTPEMQAERLDMAKNQLPVVRADLQAVTRDLNLHHTGVKPLDPTALREAQARKGQLEMQVERLLAMTNPKGKDAPNPVTKRQQAAAKREQDVAELKNALPDLPDVPPMEAGPEVAAAASDVDLMVALKRGQAPKTPRPVVREAQGSALDQWRASLPKGTQQAGGAGAGMPRAVPTPLGISEATIQSWTPQELAQELATVDAVIADRAAGGSRSLRGISRRGLGDEDLELAAYREMLTGRQASQPRLLSVPTEADEAARAYLDGLPQEQLDRLVGQMTHSYDPNVIEPSQAPRSVAKVLREQKITPDALAKALAERTGKQLPLRMRGGDSAAGGGLGIIDPAQRRLMGLKSNFATPRKVSTIEPDQWAWEQADWSVVGPQLDEYAKRHYDTAGLLVDDQRLRILGKTFSPAELTKMSKTAVAGDRIHFDLQRIAGEAKNATDEYAFIRERVRTLTTGDWRAAQAISDFYTTSETGRETLRLWREYGKQVLDKFDDLLPHESFRAYIDAEVLPNTNQGTWNLRDLERLDRVMRGKFGKMTPEQRSMAETLHRAYGDTWESTVRPTIYDNTLGSFTVTRNNRLDIEAALFASRGDDVVDVGQLANNIGSFVAEQHALKIGYNPDKVDPLMRLMMNVKGHLTPFWMTMTGGYHINNAAGNVSTQIVKAARGGDGVLPAPVVMQGWKDAAARPGSGIGIPRFMSQEIARSQATEIPGRTAAFNKQGRLRPALVGAKIKGRQRTFIPGPAQIIDAVPGIKFEGLTPHIRRSWEGEGGLLTSMENLGEAIEGYARSSVYSQAWTYHHARIWRAKLDDLLSQNVVTPPEVDDLVMRLGIDEVQQALIGKPNLDQVLAAKRSAIAQADHRAYAATADTLRDYRMRNKFDGMLDRMLPVHFWATKNMLFMTRAAMDRPALALSAAQGYNMLVEEQGETPYGIAKGYIKAPEVIKDALGLVPGSEYFLRVTQLTNPLIFALPKFVAAMQRDIDAMPDDLSLWERLEYWGKNGAANFWEASGYRVGPQWDYAIKATNRLNQNPDGRDADLMTALNFINSPYTNYQGERLGGQQGAIPLGGLESALRVLGIPGIETGISINDAVTWANQLALGSPYTNYEISQARIWMQQDASLDWENKEPLLEDGLLALADGNFDHPYVAQAMENVLKNQAYSYLRGRVFGVAGREYTLDAQRIDAGWDLYEAMQVRGKELGKTDPFVLYELPAELRWMIRSSGADKRQIEAAIQAAKDGKSHPLLDRAAKAMHNDDWALEDQQIFLATIAGGAATYDRLVEKFGQDYANRVILGGFNNLTKQTEDGLMPGLSAFMLGDPDPRQNTFDILRNRTFREGQAARDAERRGDLEERAKERPYFDRLAKNDEMLRNHVAKAGDDMRTLDVAYRAHAALQERIYADAAAAGLDLGPSGNMPREGRNHYARTQEERNFLEWNGALEAVEGLERRQARQGFLIDVIVERLGVKKYVDGELNPAFVTDGRFDQEKYDAAINAAAEDAPLLFNQLVTEYRENSPDPIEMGVNGRGITADDFRFHLRDKNAELDAYRDERQAAKSAYFDMPDETTAQKDAKEAERVRLVTVYGPEVFDRHYEETFGQLAEGEGEGPTITRDGAHRRYTENIMAAGEWYSTLSPADKAEVKQRYPDAFEKATFINEDGETIEYDKFVPSKLTGEQARKIVGENGLQDAGSDFGKDRATVISENQGTPEERTRRMDANFVQVKADEFDTMLPDELQHQLDMVDAHEETVGAQMITLDGQQMTFEDAAQLLIDDPRAQTKAGFGSWKLAAKIVGEDSELGQYILEKKRLSDEAKPARTAQVEWWVAQPDDVKELLLLEDPRGFQWLADRSNNSSGTPVSPTGESSTATTSNATGSGTSSFTPRPSSGSAFTPRPSGGSSNRGAGGGSLPGSGGLPVFEQLAQLDPVLSSGQDDGRFAIATQVSDHISRLVSVIGMMPDGKRWAQMFSALFVQWIGRMLGPDPSIEQWQAALAYLTRPRQPAGPQQPAPMAPPVTPPTPAQPEQPSGLGAY